jgi:hypothetical protein
MNWLQFLTYVIGAYLFYYLVNIFIDVGLSSNHVAGEPLTQELTFQESIEPVKIETSPVETPQLPVTEVVAAPVSAQKAKKEPVIIDSGGLSLKDFYNAARQDAILYIRPVSF